MRLSIEVPQDGYLYVVDRERYADGTYSVPYLIFPTLRTRDGSNKVAAGQPVEIPAQDDNPPYFKLKQIDSNTAYAGEVLSVIVTPRPIEGLKIGRGVQKLTKEQLAQWETKWGAQTQLLSLEGGEGQAYTKEEKEAGASVTRLLTQEEPLPQSLYRVNAKPGDPILITIPLEIK